MEHAAGCRILAVMGSGETSPTMVTTHKAMAARLPAGRRAAVLLEAPYGFQETPPASPPARRPTLPAASA